MSVDWKGALRLQIEALAKRNDLHRKFNRPSVKDRTQEMDDRIVQLREMTSMNANQAAQFYLECVCHADETERILNRTSSRDKKRKKMKSNSSQISLPSMLQPVPSASAISEVILPRRPATETPISGTKKERGVGWWSQNDKVVEEIRSAADENRPIWSSQKCSLIISLGLLLGYSNFVRFPARTYEHGGGCFIIVYLICQGVLGFPLLYLQMLLGQYSNLPLTSALSSLMPLATGLSWCYLFIGFLCFLLNNLSTSWFLFYLSHSFTSIFSSTAPWESCAELECCNMTSMTGCSNTTLISTEYYFYSTFFPLRGLQGFHIGAVDPQLALWLFLLSVIIFVTSLCRGIHRLSSLYKISVTFPFLLLCILFFRGISLEGATEGLKYLVSVNAAAIFVPQTWAFASAQVISELALCAAPIITLASYNRHNNNCLRDAAILVFISSVMSVLSAFVIFSIWGHVCFLAGIPFMRSGDLESDYITFFALSSMTLVMDFPHFWHTVIFFTLTVSSFGSQYAWFHVISTSLTTLVNNNSSRVRHLMSLTLLIVSFTIGLLFCTQGGSLLFHTLQYNLINVTTFILVLLLLILIRMYGVNKFISEVSSWMSMSSWSGIACIRPTGRFIRLSWKIFSPVFLMCLAILNASTALAKNSFAGRPIDVSYEIASWTIILLSLLILIIILVKMAIENRRKGKTLTGLIDSSNWSRGEYNDHPDEEGSAPKRMKTAMRENTYMYIDPLSRGNTVVYPIEMEDNYGWRVGRIREVQDDHAQLAASSSQPSFAASMTSQYTTNGEITLFGSPPASNAFMLSSPQAITPARVRARKSSATNPIGSIARFNLVAPPTSEEIPMKQITSSARSEPPMKMSSLLEVRSSPSPPGQRVSPARSEPPMVMRSTDRPSSSLRSKSESHDDFSDSEEEEGIRPQRITVIRRFCSQDSMGPQSINESISITPIDLPRQRSLSSVAIYDDHNSVGRGTQSLSQLKRPAPIHAPPSPTRF